MPTVHYQPHKFFLEKGLTSSPFKKGVGNLSGPPSKRKRSPSEKCGAEGCISKQSSAEDKVKQRCTADELQNNNIMHSHTPKHRSIVPKRKHEIATTPSSSPAVSKIDLKPKFQVGDEVYAAWWPDTESLRNNTNSAWYEGTITSVTERITSSIYGPDYFYNIDYIDGDKLELVADLFVMPKFDYLIDTSDERPDEWMGVKNIVDKDDSNSKDKWAKMVGWHEVTLMDGNIQSFSLLSNALRAYDDNVVQTKGADTKKCELNLPDEWEFGPEFGEQDIEEATCAPIDSAAAEGEINKERSFEGRGDSSINEGWINGVSPRTAQGESPSTRFDFNNADRQALAKAKKAYADMQFRPSQKGKKKKKKSQMLQLVDPEEETIVAAEALLSTEDDRVVYTESLQNVRGPASKEVGASASTLENTTTPAMAPMDVNINTLTQADAPKDVDIVALKDAPLKVVNPPPTVNVAELNILPKSDRKKKSSGTWLCKVEACERQAQQYKDGMCKRHFTIFTRNGRETRDPEQIAEELLQRELAVAACAQNNNDVPTVQPEVSPQPSRGATPKFLLERKKIQQCNQTVAGFETMEVLTPPKRNDTSLLKITVTASDDNDHTVQRTKPHNITPDGDFTNNEREPSRKGKVHDPALDTADDLAVGVSSPNKQPVIRQSQSSNSLQLTENQGPPKSCHCVADKSQITVEPTTKVNKRGRHKTEEIDFRSHGVNQLPSGNWQVLFYYQGKPRSMGTYYSLDDAALANKISRDVLDKTRNSTLTAEVSKQNAINAKNAAHEAVYGTSHPSSKKKMAELPPLAVEYLKAWIMNLDHSDNHYPTEDEKKDILNDTGIKLQQLNIWFAHNRKRYSKSNVEDTSRNDEPEYSCADNIAAAQPWKWDSNWDDNHFRSSGNFINDSTPMPHDDESEDNEEVLLIEADSGSDRRERNRIHAQKSRQRKRDHVENLEKRANVLKSEQIVYKQKINGRDESSNITADPIVEMLLLRSNEDIPDVTKIVIKLPADDESDLLSEDQDVHKRNRIHAKRSRERKRMFSEQLEVMVKKLEAENVLLSAHEDSMSSNDYDSNNAESEQEDEEHEIELVEDKSMSDNNHESSVHEDERDDASMSSSSSEGEVNDNGRAVGPCTCKNSKCLRLYCVCFAAEEYCYGCKCSNCQNTTMHNHARHEAIAEIRKKRSKVGLLSFQEKTLESSHIVGCKCKNSACLKKYCECFNAGITCGGKCKCVNCKNLSPSQEDQDSSSESEVEVEVKESLESEVESIDYRTVGVQQAKSGRWQVRFGYQGERRYIASYDTQDQAALANEAARTMLIDTRDAQLTMEDILHNVNAAKAAAQSAVEKASQEDQACSSESEAEEALGSKVESKIEDGISACGNSSEDDFLSVIHLDERSDGEEDYNSNTCDEDSDGSSSDDSQEQVVKRPRISWLSQRGGSSLSLSKGSRHSSKKTTAGNRFQQWRKNSKLLSFPSQCQQRKRKRDNILADEGDVRQGSPSLSTHLQSEDLFIEWLSSRKAEWSLERRKKRIRPNRTAGIRQVISGRYELRFSYQGEKRGLGTFDTKAQAVLANEAARSFLLATKGAVLSAEEIQANIQAARDVAFAAVAKQTTKPKRISVKSKIPIDYRTVGVRHSKSGKFEVGFGYQGRGRCYMGTYETQDHAALANETARSFLVSTWDDNLTAEEVKDNVQAAKTARGKTAAQAAVAASQHQDHDEDDDAAETSKLKRNRSRSTSAKKESIYAKKKSIDYRIAGVQQSKSGRWQVRFGYQGERRYIASYDTQDQAALANEAARLFLMNTRDAQLTTEDIHHNVNAAKAAAEAAVTNAHHTIDKEETRPKLLPSHLQSKESIGCWLEDRKRMWRQQRIQKRKKTKTRHSTVPNPPCTVPAQRGPSASAKSKIHIDYRTVGVRQVKSGRWEVKFLYQGSVRCFSTYDTQAHAALANEAARSFLLATRCAKLTAEEIKDNVQAAKAKAFAAAPDSRPIQKGPVLSVNRTKAPMDYRTVGVRHSKSGKFEVTIGYQGKTRCYMGTYETQDQAALANEAARSFLLATRCAKLTAEEIKVNIQAAKAAAQSAVAKASQEDQACSSASQEKNVEDDDEETRPKLLPSNLQSKESIDAWLEDRKRRWQSLRVQKPLTKPDRSAAC